MRIRIRIPASVMVLGLALTLGACATYRAAPLSLRPHRAHALADLRRTLPDGRRLVLASPLEPGTLAALAVLNDPALAAGRSTVRLAEAQRFAAGLLPDPQISGGFAALLGGPGSAPSISGAITQDIAALVTRGARLSAARAHVAAAAARFEWQEWQVAAKAETLAIRLHAERRRIAALDEARAALRELVGQARAAVRAGNLAIGAASAARSSLATLDATRDAIAQKAQADQGALASLLNLDPSVKIDVAAARVAPIPPDTVRALTDSLARRRPDLIALRYGYQAADADLRAAILSQFPLLSLTVNGGTDTTRVASLGPSLTLDLPLFNRQRGKIAVARATRVQLAAAFAAALNGAATQAEAAAQALALLERERGRAARLAASAQRDAKSARRAYTQGLIDARAETGLIDEAATRTAELIDLRRKIATGRIALRTLLGAGLPVIDPSHSPANKT